MNITLNKKKFVFVLTVCAFLLILIHSIILGIYFYIDDPDTFDFIRLFDLDYEGNIPTLFSAVLFFINGLFFYLIYSSTKQENNPYQSYWLGLALIFIFMGFDEGTRLHEEIGDLVETIVEAKGLLYFPWVIPYSIAFLIASVIYFRFYLTLNKNLKFRLFFCALIFLSGAMGLEIISAQEAETNGTSSLRYSILYTIEETLEIVGLILLIDTLVGHLSRERKSILIKLI